MMEEWLSRLNKVNLTRKQINPTDNIFYKIPYKIIEITERILKDYSNGFIPTEGLVYWGGIKEENNITVTSVIAPKTTAYQARIETDHRANLDFVRELNKHKIIQIAQVHSHPGYFIDHTEGDDYWCAFKFEGLISIVVANYCNNGMMPLNNCGVHRFSNDEFIRLSKKYIEKHFKLINEGNVNLIDLRYD